MAERETDAIGSTSPGHYGAADSGVIVQPATIAAAWNVQGDLARPSFAAIAQAELGIALPTAPNTCAQRDEATALWLGPSSWLLVAGGPPPQDATGRFVALRDALNAAGGALFDLTASRSAWRIAGPQAATVLAKGCPLDLDPRAFPAGSCAQSVLGHVNALFCRGGEEAAFTVMVARSFARDAWHFLCASSAQYGYDVLPPAPFGES